MLAIIADEIIDYIKNPSEEKLKQIQPLITSKAWQDYDISYMLQEFINKETKILNSQNLFAKSTRHFSGNLKVINSILKDNPDLASIYIEWEFVPYEHIAVVSEILKINKLLPNLKTATKLSFNAIEGLVKKLKENSTKINFDELNSSDKAVFFQEVQAINRLLAFSKDASKAVYDTANLKNMINSNEILHPDLLHDYCDNSNIKLVNDKLLHDSLTYRKNLLNTDLVKALNIDLNVLTSCEIKIITLVIKINQALSHVKTSHDMFYQEIGISMQILADDYDVKEKDGGKCQAELTLKGVKLVSEVKEIYKKLINSEFLNSEKLEFIFNDNRDDYLDQQKVAMLVEKMSHVSIMQLDQDSELIVNEYNNLLSFEDSLANSNNISILELLSLMPAAALLFLFGYCYFSNDVKDKIEEKEFSSDLVGESNE